MRSLRYVGNNNGMINGDRLACYGKKKLKVLFEREYSGEISTRNIERVIRRYKLCPDHKKAEKTCRKRASASQKPKKRGTRLVTEGRPYFLFQFDTIVIYRNNVKRYVLTAVDHATKLGYIRMYKSTCHFAVVSNRFLVFTVAG
jgi:hypothetical protein